MKYKITIKNQLKSIESLIYTTFLMLLVVVYIYRTSGYDDGILYVFGSAYFIVFIPTIFLHVEYFFRNKNMNLNIDLNNRVLKFNDDNIVNFTDIEKITLCMAPVWHRKGFIKLLSFEEYRYATIKLKSGELFIITCLMVYNLEEVMSTISGVSIEKKKRLIASPLLDSLLFNSR